MPEFVCMRILAAFPGRSNAELARDTIVSPPVMNQLLRGLEDIGAVTRPAAVPSGRTLTAQLTTKGKALPKRAEAAARVADEQILTHLTPAEQRQRAPAQPITLRRCASFDNPKEGHAQISHRAGRNTRRAISSAVKLA